MVEDAQQRVGELGVGRDTALDLLDEQWRRAWSTHVVGEPVHLPGVSVTPAPPVVQLAVAVACAPEGPLDRGRQLDSLSKGV